MGEKTAGASLQRRDTGHILPIQFEIENCQILYHAFFPHGLSQRNDPTLYDPPQHDLSDGFSMFHCDSFERRILKQIVFSFREGCPCFCLNFKFTHKDTASSCCWKGFIST